jgi:RNA polymerase sigma factor FliA
MSAIAAVPIRSREAKLLVARPLTELRRKVLHDTAAILHISVAAPAAAPAPAVVQTVVHAPIELDQVQRDKLVIEHLPQVQYIARRIHDRLPPQILFEDLVHAGILGLMDAVGKYDPNKNVQLRYYAEFRIRGAILDSLRQVDWSPRVLRRQARRLEQAVLDCKARLGRDPGELEIAAELNISLEKLQNLLRDLRGLDIGSLESDSTDANGEQSIQIPTGAEMDPYHQALRSERTALLEKGINELPERQRKILALYHFKELTMKEIGAVLGIGESRVSQIYTAALLRLRGHLRDLLADKPRCTSEALAPYSKAELAEEAALWRRSF